MITKRTGHGQTVCVGCEEKGKFGLTWDSWLYNFNDKPYCFDCLMEKLEQLQQENQSLKDKINTYENPEDLTLMFMYCDEKAKDKIKELKDRIEKAEKFCKEQKQNMYKNRNKIAVFILSKIQELLKGDKE